MESIAKRFSSRGDLCAKARRDNVLDSERTTNLNLVDCHREFLRQIGKEQKASFAVRCRAFVVGTGGNQSLNV